MNPLDLFSEPFARTGSTDARASKRAIGKSKIEFWEVFLRETLQNSWDARLHGSDRIAFGIDARRLSQNQVSVLRDTIFHSLPVEKSIRLAFEETLGNRSIEVLTVTDKGTRGLGGQTRADLASGGESSTDFVDFVRNVGRAEEKGYGGGTYGFGKGVLYSASDLSTCVVYTQTLHGGRLEPRLITICVSDKSYDHRGLRYTGRHWWGAVEDAFIEPIRGPEARHIALELGITDLDASELGTSITVISPKTTETDSQSLEGIVQAVSDAALHWAWPHMVDLGSGPSIDFTFSCEEETYEMPDPSHHPLLRDYVLAYRTVARQREITEDRSQAPVYVKGIEAERIRGPKKLGVLGFIARPREDRDEELNRNIALMREPKFVVNYHRVPETAGMSIRGVFIADAHYDSEFAQSEPVAHDDWIPDQMGYPPGQTNPVRIALRRVREHFSSFSSSVPPVASTDQPSGLAQISKRLAGVMSSSVGPGAERQRSARTRRPGTARPRTVRVALERDAELEFVDGVVRVRFPFSLSTPTGTDPASIRLQAESFVTLDDGSRESSPPDRAPVPVVLGWFKDHELIASGSTITADLLESGRHNVLVEPPPNTAIGLTITHERV